MVEFIIFVIIIWVVIKITSAKKNIENSQDIGKEVKHIAINELGVPEKIYFQLVLNHMDLLKYEALILQQDPEYSDYSWSRALAYAIYHKYNQIQSN